MKRVLVFGNNGGSYRTSNIFKFLSENNLKYRFVYINPLWFKLNAKTYFFKIIARLIQEVINIVLFLIFIIPADILFIPAMNADKFMYILIAKLFRKKVISDFYISFYDTQVNDRKNVRKKSLRAFLYKLYDKVLLIYSDVVIHLAEHELNYISKVLNIDIKKINYKIVPLCIDEKMKKTNFNFNNKLIICWWGTYIPLHGLEKIISAAQILKKQNVNFHLFLFGNNNEIGNKYKKIIKNMNLSDYVTVRNDMTFANRKLEEFLINNCDLALGIFGDSAKARNCITNKVIDAISMKIPVLTMKKNSYDEFFDVEHELYTCNNNPIDIAEKIKYIYLKTSKEDRIKRVESAYKKYNKFFTPDSYYRKISKILDEI